MAYRNSSGILKRELYYSKNITTADDVYDIIEDNVDQQSEFFELEPAIVLEVLLDTNDPKFPRSESNPDVPDWTYYGTIRARFIYSQSDGDEIDEFIKPVSSHITAYPLKGEVVNIAKHGGQHYYYNPLNLRNRVNMNRFAGEVGEGKVFDSETDKNRRIAQNEGDLIINGRFGNNIKLGSDGEQFKYPTLKITNKQSIPIGQTLNEDLPHVQDINNDGSSIFMTSGPQEQNYLIPAADSKHWPETISGDTILINSDKLVFNAKGDPDVRKSNGDIHMFAMRKINLNSNNSINIDADGVINLGNPTVTTPVVKGDVLIEELGRMMTTIESFCNQVNKQMKSVAVNGEYEKLKEEFTGLRKSFKRFLSKKVHIEYDDTRGM